MTHSTLQIDFNDLRLDMDQIGTVLGYGEGADRQIVNIVVEEILSEPDLFRNIRAEYKIYDDIEFVKSDRSLDINNVNFLINKIVYGQLGEADSLAVFLCTAGEEIGLRTRQSMAEGDPVKGYIYDIIGSMAVDAAADALQRRVEEAAISQGKKITNRYCPGYCGWDVSEQHKLFRLFPDNFCGIRLTASALMDPVKSISGIIGLGEKVRYNKSTCSLCSMKECSFREVSERKS